MISNAKNREPSVQMEVQSGKGKLVLDKLLAEPRKPEKVRMYAKATLEPGCSVGYHVHTAESETYFILAGKGAYNDNGTMITVEAGDVTYTPDGEGHGLENIGDTPLEFMALIVLD